MSYVGRFAPSPTGPLHLGSLVTAVASFLHARQAARRVARPHRRHRSAARSAAARRTRSCVRSRRSSSSGIGPFSIRARGSQPIERPPTRLLADGRAFRCRCSRSEIRAGNDGAIRALPRHLPRAGHCRPATPPIRARVDPGSIVIDDGLQGAIETDLAASSGDYVIVRRDGLPAYHLAVVLDDAEQGVTTVVRGVDLLESTAAHLHLQGVLGAARRRAISTCPWSSTSSGKSSRSKPARKPIEAADARRGRADSRATGTQRARPSSRASARAFCGNGRSAAGASTLCAAGASSRSD